ncbi:MAG: serine/threonine-protein kinase [Phycisphaerales bacterium]
MADCERSGQPGMSAATDLADLIDRFAELCDAAPHERDRWLDELEGRDPAAARMLRRMLEAEASGEARTLDTPLLDLDAELIDGHATIDAMPSHAPGLGGRYEVLRPLGFGANGDVYLARQRHPIEREVAVKVLRPSQVRPNTVERMAREAKALAALSHPNIATVFEAGQTDDGRPFIATEFVAGEPVDAWCESSAISAQARILTLARVCRAVEHMHQRGVIHRDLKPTNILVSGTPDDPHPKILDLGIARIIGEDGQAAPTLTQHGALLGSLGYIAPEQFKGAPADTRSDIFALGRVLEKLLKDLSDAWVSRHARDVAAVVRMATEAEPARRYPSAGAFADDLEGLLHERGVAARPPSRREALWRLVRRHKFTTALGVLAVASSLAAIATLSYSAQQLQRNNEFQKATITDTFDGLVLYLGRYGGTHEQRAQLVSTMERQLDELLSYSPNDPDLLILRARLLTERARLHIGLHQPERAQPLSEAAVALMERLVDVRTSTEQDLAHKALTLIIRGDVHYELPAVDGSRCGVPAHAAPACARPTGRERGPRASRARRQGRLVQPRDGPVPSGPQPHRCGPGPGDGPARTGV